MFELICLAVVVMSVIAALAIAAASSVPQRPDASVQLPQSVQPDSKPPPQAMVRAAGLQ